MDLKNITDIEIEGIDTNDYPDFCDAYISSAYCNWRKLTELELDKLNDDADFVHEKVYEHLF